MREISVFMPVYINYIYFLNNGIYHNNCVVRHVGSLGSGQYLNTGVKIALSLAQDTSSPMVQVRVRNMRNMVSNGSPINIVDTSCIISLLYSSNSNCPSQEWDVIH